MGAGLLSAHTLTQEVAGPDLDLCGVLQHRVLQLGARALLALSWGEMAVLALHCTQSQLMACASCALCSVGHAGCGCMRPWCVATWPSLMVQMVWVRCVRMDCGVCR